MESDSQIAALECATITGANNASVVGTQEVECSLLMLPTVCGHVFCSLERTFGKGKKRNQTSFDIACGATAVKQCGCCFRYMCFLHCYPIPDVVKKIGDDVFANDEWCTDCVIDQMSSLCATIKADSGGRLRAIRTKQVPDDLYSIAIHVKCLATKHRSVIVQIVTETGQLISPAVRVIQRAVLPTHSEKALLSSRFSLRFLGGECNEKGIYTNGRAVTLPAKNLRNLEQFTQKRYSEFIDKTIEEQEKKYKAFTKKREENSNN